MRWKNGGGETSEIHREDGEGDSLRFRVSLAKIESDGPFSSFPGIDRILVLIEGDEMELAATASAGGAAWRESLRLYELLRFRGEEVIEAHVFGRTTRDLNVMWQRGAFAQVACEIRRESFEVTGRAALVVLRGEMELDCGGEVHVLSAHDTALIDAQEFARAASDGAIVAAITLR